MFSCYLDGRFSSLLVIAIAIASDVPIVCDYRLACLLFTRCPIAVTRRVLRSSRLNVDVSLFLDGLDALLTLSTVAPMPDNLNKMLKIGLDQKMISPFSLYPFRIPQDQYSSVFLTLSIVCYTTLSVVTLTYY